MKKTIRDRIKDFPSIEDIIKEDERSDPEFKTMLERARLRVAIARQIKIAREKAGMTQAELAQALELPQSVIGRLEGLQDKRLPSIDLLTRIARVTRKRLVLDFGTAHLELVAK
ncbi:MAG: helix-turn-helix transcriptional regulator [Nitrospirae bacterium]|nr:helix-turn-helix transcriptional regulator [Nitrospirota bacterium]